MAEDELDALLIELGVTEYREFPSEPVRLTFWDKVRFDLAAPWIMPPKPGSEDRSWRLLSAVGVGLTRYVTHHHS